MTVHDTVMEAKANLDKIMIPDKLDSTRPINIYLPPANIQIRQESQTWTVLDSLATSGIVIGLLWVGYLVHVISR